MPDDGLLIEEPCYFQSIRSSMFYIGSGASSASCR